MFWRHKAQLLGTNQNRTDQLQTQITNYLADKPTRWKTIEQSSSSTPQQPSLIVVVAYDDKTVSDQVWADIEAARTGGWIKSPSWAGYGQVPESPADGEYVLLGYLTW